jgi:hypothetical protein
VLAKLAALPITTWAYTNAPSVRHLGPVAQDFAAAFGLGDNDKHIATVDADGVALAAIQGLNEIVRGQRRELQAKADQIDALEKRLAALERLAATLAGSPIRSDAAAGPGNSAGASGRRLVPVSPQQRFDLAQQCGQVMFHGAPDDDVIHRIVAVDDAVPEIHDAPQ